VRPFALDTTWEVEWMPSWFADCGVRDFNHQSYVAWSTLRMMWPLSGRRSLLEVGYLDRLSNILCTDTPNSGGPDHTGGRSPWSHRIDDADRVCHILTDKYVCTWAWANRLQQAGIMSRPGRGMRSPNQVSWWVMRCTTPGTSFWGFDHSLLWGLKRCRCVTGGGFTKLAIVDVKSLSWQLLE
jgi:hypothetical protein